MLRCTAAFATAAPTALFLGLREPVLAAGNAERLLFVCFLVAFLRSPVWLHRFVGVGKAGSA
jgi:hypothetical protein